MSKTAIKNENKKVRTQVFHQVTKPKENKNLVKMSKVDYFDGKLNADENFLVVNYLNKNGLFSVSSDEYNFLKLKEEISQFGIMSPIHIREIGGTNKKRYEIISGNRRITAHRELLNTDKNFGSSEKSKIPYQVVDQNTPDDIVESMRRGMNVGQSLSLEQKLEIFFTPLRDDQRENFERSIASALKSESRKEFDYEILCFAGVLNRKTETMDGRWLIKESKISARHRISFWIENSKAMELFRTTFEKRFVLSSKDVVKERKNSFDLDITTRIVKLNELQKNKLNLEIKLERTKSEILLVESELEKLRLAQ